MAAVESAISPAVFKLEADVEVVIVELGGSGLSEVATAGKRADE